MQYGGTRRAPQEARERDGRNSSKKKKHWKVESQIPPWAAAGKQPVEGGIPAPGRCTSWDILHPASALALTFPSGHMHPAYLAFRERRGEPGSGATAVLDGGVASLHRP